jgi:hypothetical protein
VPGSPAATAPDERPSPAPRLPAQRLLAPREAGRRPPHGAHRDPFPVPLPPEPVHPPPAPLPRSRAPAQQARVAAEAARASTTRADRGLISARSGARASLPARVRSERYGGEEPQESSSMGVCGRHGLGLRRGTGGQPDRSGQLAGAGRAPFRSAPAAEHHRAVADTAQPRARARPACRATRELRARRGGERSGAGERPRAGVARSRPAGQPDRRSRRWLRRAGGALEVARSEA